MSLGHGQDIEDASPSGMRQRAWEVLDAAYAAGIRHIDVARSYGLAEDFLSEWIGARSPSQLFISSKWGYRYTGQWQRHAPLHEVKDLSLSHFETQWTESSARLGPHLSRYHIHSATLESGVLKDAALLRRLSKLKAVGVEVGLTTTGIHQREIIEQALDIHLDGRRLFSAVQSTWNLLEPSAGPTLAAAAALGVSVTIKEPMANGRLGPRGDVAPWQDYCRERQEAPDALALASALRQPWASCVLSGAVSVAQLKSNLRALSVTTPVEFCTPLSAADFWSQRQALPWN
jgi:aryl-alcohol dehydrogenase-like predicted oxidoreductase